MTTNFTKNKYSRTLASKFRNIRDFNMVIVGTGGQGQITLLKILAEAAFFEGYDVKISELHGLSQRGGSVEAQIRFGKKVYSPLVSEAGADLILALEIQEALGGLYYANEETQFLLNKFSLPISGQSLTPENEVLKEIKKFTQKIEIMPGSEICKKELGKEILAGIYLISLASFKKLMPLKTNSILKAIKKVIPEKYLGLNLKAFNLARKKGK